MDLLCLSLVFIGAGMALVIAVMLGVTQRAGHQAITRNFQAAEFIIAEHRPPPSWTRQPAWRRLLRRRDAARQSAEHARNLRRLAALIVFFEHSTFFADEDAREALLGQLREERVRWQEGGGRQ